MWVESRLQLMKQFTIGYNVKVIKTIDSKSEECV